MPEHTHSVDMESNHERCYLFFVFSSKRRRCRGTDQAGSGPSKGKGTRGSLVGSFGNWIAAYAGMCAPDRIFCFLATILVGRGHGSNGCPTSAGGKLK